MTHETSSGWDNPIAHIMPRQNGTPEQFEALKKSLERNNMETYTQINLDECSKIRIVSTDEQDAGKFYLVDKINIISIENDCEGNIIWWKEYSPLEGSYFTNSAHFVNYELV